MYGLIGFLSFFSIIIIGKLFRYIFNFNDVISIDEVDVILSAVGFVMIFISKRFGHM